MEELPPCDPAPCSAKNAPAPEEGGNGRRRVEGRAGELTKGLTTHGKEFGIEFVSWEAVKGFYVPLCAGCSVGYEGIGKC